MILLLLLSSLFPSRAYKVHFQVSKYIIDIKVNNNSYGCDITQGYPLAVNLPITQGDVVSISAWNPPKSNPFDSNTPGALIAGLYYSSFYFYTTSSYWTCNGRPAYKVTYYSSRAVQISSNAHWIWDEYNSEYVTCTITIDVNSYRTNVKIGVDNILQGIQVNSRNYYASGDLKNLNKFKYADIYIQEGETLYIHGKNGSDEASILALMVIQGSYVYTNTGQWRCNGQSPVVPGTVPEIKNQVPSFAQWIWAPGNPKECTCTLLLSRKSRPITYSEIKNYNIFVSANQILQAFRINGVSYLSSLEGNLSSYTQIKKMASIEIKEYDLIEIEARTSNVSSKGILFYVTFDGKEYWTNSFNWECNSKKAFQQSASSSFGEVSSEAEWIWDEGSEIVSCLTYLSPAHFATKTEYFAFKLSSDSVEEYFEECPLNMIPNGQDGTCIFAEEEGTMVASQINSLETSLEDKNVRGDFSLTMWMYIDSLEDLNSIDDEAEETIGKTIFQMNSVNTDVNEYDVSFRLRIISPKVIISDSPVSFALSYSSKVGVEPEEGTMFFSFSYSEFSERIISQWLFIGLTNNSLTTRKVFIFNDKQTEQISYNLSAQDYSLVSFILANNYPFYSKRVMLYNTTLSEENLQQNRLSNPNDYTSKYYQSNLVLYLPFDEVEDRKIYDMSSQPLTTITLEEEELFPEFIEDKKSVYRNNLSKTSIFDRKEEVASILPELVFCPPGRKYDSLLKDCVKDKGGLAFKYNSSSAPTISDVLIPNTDNFYLVFYVKLVSELEDQVFSSANYLTLLNLQCSPSVPLSSAISPCSQTHSLKVSHYLGDLNRITTEIFSNETVKMNISSLKLNSQDWNKIMILKSSKQAAQHILSMKVFHRNIETTVVNPIIVSSSLEDSSLCFHSNCSIHFISESNLQSQANIIYSFRNLEIGTLAGNSDYHRQIILDNLESNFYRPLYYFSLESPRVFSSFLGEIPSNTKYDALSIPFMIDKLSYLEDDDYYAQLEEMHNKTPLSCNLSFIDQSKENSSCYRTNLRVLNTNSDEIKILNTEELKKSKVFTMEVFFKPVRDFFKGAQERITVVRFSIFTLNIVDKKFILEYYSNKSPSFALNSEVEVVGNAWQQVAFSIYPLDKSDSEYSNLSTVVGDVEKSSKVISVDQFTDTDALYLNQNGFSTREFSFLYSYIRIWRSALSKTKVNYYKGKVIDRSIYSLLFSYYDFRVNITKLADSSGLLQKKYFDSAVRLIDDNSENYSTFPPVLGDSHQEHTSSYQDYKYASTDELIYKPKCDRTNILQFLDNEFHCKTKKDLRLLPGGVVKLSPPVGDYYIELYSFTLDFWISVDLLVELSANNTETIFSLEGYKSENDIRYLLESYLVGEDVRTRLGIYLKYPMKVELYEEFSSSNKHSIHSQTWTHCAFSVSVETNRMVYSFTEGPGQNTYSQYEDTILSTEPLNNIRAERLLLGGTPETTPSSVSSLYKKLFFKSFRLFNTPTPDNSLRELMYLKVDGSNHRNALYVFYFDDSPGWDSEGKLRFYNLLYNRQSSVQAGVVDNHIIVEVTMRNQDYEGFNPLNNAMELIDVESAPFISGESAHGPLDYSEVFSPFCEIGEVVNLISHANDNIYNYPRVCYSEETSTEIYGTRINSNKFSFTSTQTMTIDLWFYPSKELTTDKDDFLSIVKVIEGTDDMEFCRVQISNDTLDFIISESPSVSFFFDFADQRGILSYSDPMIHSFRWNYLSLRVNYNHDFYFSINGVFYPENYSEEDIQSLLSYPFRSALEFREPLIESKYALQFMNYPAYFKRVKIYREALDYTEINERRHSEIILRQIEKYFLIALYLPLSGKSYPKIIDYSFQVNQGVDINDQSVKEYELSNMSSDEASVISSSLLPSIRYDNKHFSLCTGDASLDQNANACFLLFYDYLQPKIRLNNGEVHMLEENFGLLRTSNYWFFTFWFKISHDLELQSDFLVFGQYRDSNDDSFCSSPSTIREVNPSSLDGELYTTKSALYVKYEVSTKHLQVFYVVNNIHIKVFSILFDQKAMSNFVFAFEENTLKVYIDMQLISDESNYFPIELDQLSVRPGFNSNCKFLMGKTLGSTEAYKTDEFKQLMFIDQIGISSTRFTPQLFSFMYKNEISQDVPLFLAFLKFQTIVYNLVSIKELSYQSPLYDNNKFIPPGSKYITDEIIRRGEEKRNPNEYLCPGLTVNNREVAYSENCLQYNSLFVSSSSGGVPLVLNNKLVNEFTVEFSFKLIPPFRRVTLMQIGESTGNEYYIIFEIIEYKGVESFIVTYQEYYSKVFPIETDKWYTVGVRSTIVNHNKINSSAYLASDQGEIQIESSSLYYNTVANKLLLGKKINSGDEVSEFALQYIKVYNFPLSDGMIRQNLNKFQINHPSFELNTYYDFRFYFDIVKRSIIEYDSSSEYLLSDINSELLHFQTFTDFVVCGMASTLVLENDSLICKKNTDLAFSDITEKIFLTYPPENDYFELKEFTIELWFSVDCFIPIGSTSSIVSHGSSVSDTSIILDINSTKEKSSLTMNLNNKGSKFSLEHSNSNVKKDHWNYYAFTIYNQNKPLSYVPNKKPFSFYNSNEIFNSLEVHSEAEIPSDFSFEFNPLINTIFLNLGIHTNYCLNMHMRLFRFWNKARTPNQILENQYTSLIGSYYRHLIYNLILSSAGYEIVNDVKQLYAESKRSIDLRISSSLVNDYYVIKLDQFRFYELLTKQLDPIEMKICPSGSSKNLINKKTLGETSTENHPSTLIKCRPEIGNKSSIGTHINKISFLLSTEVDMSLGEIQIEFWGLNTKQDNSQEIEPNNKFISLKSYKRDIEELKTLFSINHINSVSAQLSLLDNKYNFLELSIEKRKWVFYTISFSALTKKVQLNYSLLNNESVTRSISTETVDQLLIDLQTAEEKFFFLSINEKPTFSSKPFYLKNFKMFNTIRDREVSIEEVYNQESLYRKFITQSQKMINGMILFLPLIRFESLLDHSEYENRVVVDYTKAGILVKEPYLNSYYVLSDINEEYDTPGIYQGLVTDEVEVVNSDNSNLMICEGNSIYKDSSCVLSEYSSSFTILPSDLDISSVKFPIPEDIGEYYYLRFWFKLSCKNCLPSDLMQVNLLESYNNNFFLEIYSHSSFKFKVNTEDGLGGFTDTFIYGSEINFPEEEWVQVILIKNTKFFTVIRDYGNYFSKTEISEYSNSSFERAGDIELGKSVSSSKSKQYNSSFKLRSFLMGKGNISEDFHSLLFNMEFIPEDLDLVFYYKLEYYDINLENEVLILDEVSEEEVPVSETDFVLMDNELGFRENGYIDLTSCSRYEIQFFTDSNEERFCSVVNYHQLPYYSAVVLTDTVNNKGVRFTPDFTLELTFRMETSPISSVNLLTFSNSQLLIRVNILLSTITIEMQISGSSSFHSKSYLIQGKGYENTLFILSRHFYDSFDIECLFNDNDLYKIAEIHVNEYDIYNSSGYESSLVLADNPKILDIDTNNFFLVQYIRLWSKSLILEEMSHYQKKILIKELTDRLDNPFLLYLDFRFMFTYTDNTFFDYQKSSNNNSFSLVNSNYLPGSLSLHKTLMREVKSECGSSVYGQIDTTTNSLVCNYSQSTILNKFICEENYYSDFSDIYNPQCKSCEESCSQCFLNSSHCTECETSFYSLQYNKGKCLAEQSLSHIYLESFISPFEWRECNSSCLECHGPSTDNCLSCEQGLVLSQNNECASSCDPGFYLDISSGCTECASECESCEISNKHCLLCSEGNFLIGANTCGTECLEGFYLESDLDGGKTCLKCSYQCDSCVDTSTNCTACAYGYFNVFNLIGCFSECPDGTYLDDSNIGEIQCSLCDSSCKTCADSPTNCTNCQNYFHFPSNSCVDSCPMGYFPDDADNKCRQCHSSCLNCSNATSNCIECKEGFIRNPFDQCVTTCPLGYILEEEECSPCESPCKTCEERTDNCISCLSGFYQVEGTGECVMSCGEGFYEDSSEEKCKKCATPCKDCSSVSVCISCIDQYHLLTENNTCVEECPLGKTPLLNNSVSMCYDCIENCDVCDNITECNICSNEYSLIETSLLCSRECLFVTYKTTDIEERSVCRICSTECLECVDNSTKCTNCKEGSVLLKEEFSCLQVSQIPLGFYYLKSTKSLGQCHDQCKTCSGGDYDQCFSCYEESSLPTLYNNTCISYCQSNEIEYYLDSENIPTLNHNSGVRECLKISSCVIDLGVESPNIIDIKSEGVFKITVSYNLMRNCIQVLEVLNGDVINSSLSSINNTLVDDFLEVTIELPSSVERVYEETPLEKRLGKVFTFKESIFPQGTHKIKGVISSIDKEGVRPNMLVQSKNREIIAKELVIIPSLNIPRTDQGEFHTTVYYPEPFILDASNSEDEFWEGLNEDNLQLECSWCQSDLGICQDESQSNTILSNNEDDNTNSCIKSITNYQSEYLDYLFRELDSSGGRNLQAVQEKTVILSMKLTIRAPYRNSSSYSTVIQLNLIQKSEELLQTVTLLNNLPSNNNSGESDPGNSISQSSSTTSSQSGDILDKEQIRSNLLQLLSGAKVTSNHSGVAQYSASVELPLEVKNIQYQWLIRETVNEENFQNAENSLSNTSINSSINSQSLFLTPTNDNIVKIDTSSNNSKQIFLIARISLNEVVNSDNNEAVSVEFDVVNTIENYRAPSDGICLPNKRQITFGDKLRINTQNWISKGSLVFSLWQIDQYSTQLTEKSISRDMEVDNPPLGKNFYVEAFDTETKKYSYASCEVEVLPNEDIQSSDLVELIDQNLNLDEKTQIEKLDSIISMLKYLDFNNKSLNKESSSYTANEIDNIDQTKITNNIINENVVLITGEGRRRLQSNSSGQERPSSNLNPVERVIELHSSVSNLATNNKLNSNVQLISSKIIKQTNRMSELSSISEASLSNMITNVREGLPSSNNAREEDNNEVLDSVFDTSSNLADKSFYELNMNMDAAMDLTGTKIKEGLIIGETNSIYKPSVFQNTEIMRKANNVTTTEGGSVESGQRYLLNQNLFPVKNEPESFPFSLDSIGLDIGLRLKNGSTERVLNANNTNVLHTPNLENETTSSNISDVSCAMMDETKQMNSTTCQTWFNYEENTVECECGIVGQVFSVFDKGLSDINKLNQIVLPNQDLVNAFNLTIIIFLSSTFGVLAVIFCTIDFYESEYDEYIQHEKNDFLQRTVTETCLEFDFEHSKLDFRKFFMRNLISFHTLLTIYTFRSLENKRYFRLVEVILLINLRFMFTLFPYNFRKNDAMVEVQERRSIKMKSNYLDTAQIFLIQILESMVFTLVAKVANAFILNFLNLIYSDNFTEREVKLRNERMEHLFEHFIKGDINEFAHEYKKKLERARLKLSFIYKAKKKAKLINGEDLQLYKKDLLMKCAVSKTDKDRSRSSKRNTNASLFPNMIRNSQILMVLDKRHSRIKAKTMKHAVQMKKSAYRIWLKGVISTGLIFACWILTFIFIRVIYRNFRDDAFFVLIVPIISIMLVSFFISEPIILLIHSALCWFLGEKYYKDNSKIGMAYNKITHPLIKAKHKYIILLYDLSIFLRYAN